MSREKTNCKIDSHVPTEAGDICECAYFVKRVKDMDYYKHVRDTVSNFRNFKNDIKQVVIEDVPHQYQERILELLK